MTISKHDFEEYLGVSGKEAHAYMGMLNPKLPTKTIYIEDKARFITVSAKDTIDLCNRMMNSNHAKVQKEKWKTILNVAVYKLNKGLSECKM